MMDYEEILSALAVPEINHYVRDEVASSYPVVGLYDGKIVDCYFIYCVPLTEEDNAEGPLAVLIVDSENQKLNEYSEKESTKIDVISSCDDENFWKADERFEELYPMVRSFAFSKSISQSQKESLKLFLDTFDMLVSCSLRKIYVELFPDFFEWANEICRDELRSSV